MEASKGAMLMRCDDIDGLCAANPNYYAGHHRQSAPAETVICDYFYTSKSHYQQFVSKVLLSMSVQNIMQVLICYIVTCTSLP